MTWGMKKEVLEVCGISDPSWLPKSGVYSVGQHLYISTPHFLNNTLYLYDYEGDTTCATSEREFHEFANRAENRHKPWLTLMEEFAKDKGLDVIAIEDTSNVDNDLDQDFQYGVTWRR